VSRREDVEHNRLLWDAVNEQFSGADGLARWRRTDIVWGLFETPEVDLEVLGDVAGLDVVELGCGVAHVSAWLARRGARCVAVDLSGAQLASARTAQVEHGLAFGLLQADAERLPLTSRCADLVISEHGTPAWCEPEAWVAQAARILRPGGRLVFLTNSPLSAMCVPAEGGPAGDRLLRGPAELREVRWPGGGIEHHPTHGDWVRILVGHGFVVEALRELHAPTPRQPAANPEPAGSGAGAGSVAPAGTGDPQGDALAAADYYAIADRSWAARWPIEDLWSARLASGLPAATGAQRW
jgi:SAM-dependent methyltransferase